MSVDSTNSKKNCTVHPERKIYAHGLCSPCYKKQRRDAGKDKKPNGNCNNCTKYECLVSGFCSVCNAMIARAENGTKVYASKLPPEEEKLKNREKSKKYRERHKIIKDVFCDFCNEIHRISEFAYQKNIKKYNGVYICKKNEKAKINDIILKKASQTDIIYETKDY